MQAQDATQQVKQRTSEETARHPLSALPDKLLVGNRAASPENCQVLPATLGKAKGKEDTKATKLPALVRAAEGDAGEDGSSSGGNVLTDLPAQEPALVGAGSDLELIKASTHTVIGDTEKLFWRISRQCKIRIYELENPECYAAQIHVADTRECLNALYFDKQKVDTNLDVNYILTGTPSGGGRRATFNVMNSMESFGDDRREMRRREEILRVCSRAINIEKKDGSLIASHSSQKGKTAFLAFLATHSHILPSLVFEDKRRSRAELLGEFERISKDFANQMNSIKGAKAHALQQKQVSDTIQETCRFATSPNSIRTLLERVKKRSMLKLKTVSLFAQRKTF